MTSFRRLWEPQFSCRSEQVPELTSRLARRTPLLQRVLAAVALAPGGRAGARLTRRPAASVSQMTLPRILRGLPDPDRSTPRILAVDDFALRRQTIWMPGWARCQ
ncbi:hypothetical protein ABZ863_30410 [Saccharomonospora sp. NPDC046836]|uniref:hypothetical protein n=1 Tax=Saccharomonospora sp. NPDC046836 TaxID=3156921 RepID=UPI0033C17520